MALPSRHHEVLANDMEALFNSVALPRPITPEQPVPKASVVPFLASEAPPPAEVCSLDLTNATKGQAKGMGHVLAHE